MIPPILRSRPLSGPQQLESEDGDALLRRLDAETLLEIHEGLDWCDRELRALSPFQRARRSHVRALRRRWALRWRVATGRPDVTLQVHRAWQGATMLAVGLTLVALLSAAQDEAEPSRTDFSSVQPVRPLTAPPSGIVDSTQPPARVTDGVARGRARRAARTLDRCKAATGSFAACPVESGRHVMIEAGDQTFTVSATSSSANVFVISRLPDGTTERTCMPTRRSRLCPPSGRW
jgi:hypothetical protein